MLKRVVRSVLFVVYTFVATTFLAFLVLEWFPWLVDRLHVRSIRYYAMFTEYMPDTTLVFVPRRITRAFESDFKGDMSVPSFGVDVPAVRYVATYTAEGFRTNSSAPPYDVVLIGDSYFDIGESDRDTLSERLKAVSSLATLNLSTGWYGPYQYLELFKRYGLSTGARVAVIGIFAGNDIEDIRQYAKWLNGGDYYHYVLGRRTVFRRYLVVLEDLVSPVRKAIRAQFGRPQPAVLEAIGQSGEAIHPQEGNIQLGGTVTRMRFAYWNMPLTPDQLLDRDEWRRLRSLLAEFKTVAESHGIVPVVMYIPTKIQVYGRLAGDGGGTEFRRQIAQQVLFESNAEKALQLVARDVQIELVDLLPGFQERARHGELLYYQFDTHWNTAGRQAAADMLVHRLAGLLPKPVKSPGGPKE